MRFFDCALLDARSAERRRTGQQLGPQSQRRACQPRPDRSSANHWRVQLRQPVCRRPSRGKTRPRAGAVQQARGWPRARLHFRQRRTRAPPAGRSTSEESAQQRPSGSLAAPGELRADTEPAEPRSRTTRGAVRRTRQRHHAGRTRRPTPRWPDDRPLGNARPDKLLCRHSATPCDNGTNTHSPRRRADRRLGPVQTATPTLPSAQARTAG